MSGERQSAVGSREQIIEIILAMARTSPKRRAALRRQMEQLADPQLRIRMKNMLRSKAMHLPKDRP